jgi:diguanylate cyclase (GGDEF)-like protein
VEDIELSVRIEAALIRLQGRERLLADRDFFRAAVKQEEYLSSLALERSIDVQNSYRKLAMVNDRLREQNQRLRQIARIDPLSGLMNRLSLYDVADTEVERAVRNDASLCGIMIDVDHFKQINDNHGHHCGDRVIQYLGRFLRQRLRRYDAAGRYGGEEFFVILPNTHVAQAWHFATRFRQNLESTVIACEGAEITVTASSGIAEYRSEESRDSWIARADRAMYAAKQRGRNRVEIELDRDRLDG